MEILEGILTRRSIRRYTCERVPDEMIMHILEAGMYAPSAVNRQPWHFIVIRSKETFRQIMKIHPYAGMLESADVAFLVCGDTKLEHGPGYWVVDCSAATQNMLLAIHGLGLGGVWVGIHPREQRKEAMRQIFGLPENIQPAALIACGRPAESKPHPQRFRKEKIHWEIW
ncbi:MAG: nitroreductase family protein [Chlorobi bacterium]|nr:nitroreductase family protein [Chlorobiota bacterium]